MSLILLQGLSACGHFVNPARRDELQKGQVYWFDYDASRRGAFLVVADDREKLKKIRLCAEPSPDVALARSQEILAKVSYQNMPAELQVTMAEQIVALGKRTETVMFLRESLFRLCELSQNGDLNNGDLKELYEKVINAAVSLADAEKADSEKVRAEAERTKALQALPVEIQKRLVQ